MIPSDRYKAVLQPLALRSLPARSVIASALLGAGSRGLRVAVLVYLTESFGVPGGSARVALSRMLAVGEVESANGRYRLAGRMLERQALQRESRWPGVKDWDGSWAMWIPHAFAHAKTSIELQGVLANLRMAEYCEGIWIRPDNLVSTPDASVQSLIRKHFGCFLARPEEDPRALVARLWDLKAWAKRARALRDAMVHLADDLAEDVVHALAPGFMVSAAVLRHMAADPLAPPGILPEDWPGALLRSEFELHDAAWQRLLKSIMKEKSGEQPSHEFV